MKAKIEIGITVKGSLGTGTITKIITKSTGYVEVTYTNGKVKKEMAFNLTNVEGEELKSKPVVKHTPQAILDRNFNTLCNNIRAAYDEEHGYVTGHSMEYIMKSSCL